jgi:hypothetical protein
MQQPVLLTELTTVLLLTCWSSLLRLTELTHCLHHCLGRQCCVLIQVTGAALVLAAEASAAAAALHHCYWFPAS